MQSAGQELPNIGASCAGKGFRTLEIPSHLAEQAETLSPGGTALLECLSNLLANEQFGEGADDPAQTVLDGIVATVSKGAKTW